MSFNRHREIYRSDEDASMPGVPAHRLDEFPAGYSWVGCAPALPASASPAASEYAVILSCRSIPFRRTANSVLSVCLSLGGSSRSTSMIVILSPNSVTSEWCQQELRTAFNLERKKKQTFLIPALYEKCEVPSLLMDKFWADMRGDNYEESLSMIVERLRELKSANAG